MLPALQEKLPVVAGVVEKAACTVLVFIPWLKVKERLEATEIAVEWCAIVTGKQIGRAHV